MIYSAPHANRLIIKLATPVLNSQHLTMLSNATLSNANFHQERKKLAAGCQPKRERLL